MTVAALLGSMAREGGRLEIAGDRLVYHGPRHLLSDEARRYLDDHRDAILAFLRTPIDGIPKSELALFDYKRTLSKADVDWIDRTLRGNQPGRPTP